MKIKLFLLGLLLFMSCPTLSFADPVMMSIQPNGKGSFFMTGENVIGVQALDIDIDYDSSMLESPYVVIMGGDLSQIKADVPGKLFLSVFRPVADALLQIIVNFEARSDNTSSGISHVSASAKSMTKWPAEPDADSPSTSGGFEDGSAAGPAAESSETEKVETVPKVNPTVALDSNKRADTLSAMTGSSSSADSDKQVRTEEITILTRDEKSVLQRFKKFEGVKGLNAFVALFERSDGDTTVQEPAIALSDGETPVTITMEVQPDEGSQITLALSDARLLSKETNKKGIIISVLPNKGTWDARLVILAGRNMIDYPLVVAPPVNLAGNINEDNFIGALHAYIIDQLPALHIQNKTYLSEYIFTANYLVDLGRKAR